MEYLRVFRVFRVSQRKRDKEKNIKKRNREKEIQRENSGIIIPSLGLINNIYTLFNTLNTLTLSLLSDTLYKKYPEQKRI